MRLATVSFVFVFVIAAVTFGYTWQGQMAYMQRDSITATATGYSVSSGDDGEVVTVTVRVQNPTNKPIQIHYGNIRGELDGDQVVRSASLDEIRVPAGGEKTFTVDCMFVGGASSGDTLARIRDGDMQVDGQLSAYLVDEKIHLEVEEDA